MPHQTLVPTPSRPRPLTPRQEEIVEAAIGVVREEGWSSLTVRRLAERLGVTDPALYRHFAGKGELALAIAGRMQASLLGPARAIAADSRLSARKKIERILVHHVDLVLATDGLPVLLIAEAATGDPAMAERLRAIMGEYAAILLGLLAALAPGPAAPSPRATLIQLLGLPAVVAIQRRLLPELAPSEPELRRLAVRHVRQVLPRSAPKRRRQTR